MRLGVHAGTLRGWGSAALGRAVVRGLAMELVGDGMIVFHPREWAEFSVEGRARTLVPVDGGMLQKLRLELRLLRARGIGIDVLFTLGDTGPIRPRVPHVLLVQQAHLAYEAHDWGYSADPRTRSRFALMAEYFRAGLGGVTAFTVQTHDMKSRLVDRWRLERDRVHVVPSAVEPFAELAPEAARSKATRPTVCCIASPAAHKNHAVLPDVARELRARHPDVRIVLSAHVRDLPAVARRAEVLGCADVFEFRGPMSRLEVRRALEESHVALVPSQLESFGFHFFEAMTCGCPVVSADRGFAREACEDAALYADAASPAALSSAIDELLGDRDLAARLAQRGRAIVEQKRRGWDRVSAEYAALLRSIA